MPRPLRLSLLFFAMTALVACGGNPPPETGPETDADSLAQARRDSIARADSIRRARERAAAAEELCQRARSAMDAGNYDEARELYQRALEAYPGTGCAESADARLATIDVVQTIRERVHFEFDRATITDEAAAVLERKARVLREHQDLRIRVEGHCDERGSNEYNMALGQRRAQAAMSYLVDLGVSRDRFETISFGEERPLANRSTEQAWAMNRRAEFVIQNMSALQTSE